jgi:hypothetical protein
MNASTRPSHARGGLSFEVFGPQTRGPHGVITAIIILIFIIVIIL